MNDHSRQLFTILICYPQTVSYIVNRVITKVYQTLFNENPFPKKFPDKIILKIWFYNVLSTIYE